MVFDVPGAPYVGDDLKVIGIVWDDLFGSFCGGLFGAFRGTGGLFRGHFGLTGTRGSTIDTETDRFPLSGGVKSCL